MKKMNRPQPCLHCSSRKIVWDDCGYSSFNCGEAKCENCGFILKLGSLSCSPEKEIRNRWNAQRKEAIARLIKLRQEVEQLEKILGEDA